MKCYLLSVNSSSSTDIFITPQVENFMNWSSVQERTKLISLLESYSKKFHDRVKPVNILVLHLNDFASVYRHLT